MSDLISRSALIAEYDRVHVGPPGGARKLMEDAPAIEPYGTWIPCSERLPKQGQQIIGTFTGTKGNTLVSQEQFFKEILMEPYPMIAWMPLPEPYREEKKHDNLLFADMEEIIDATD